MADPIPLFKFSHAGQVFQEGLTLSEADKFIAEKTILPTDHYWTDGMTEWKLVSSRTWVNPSESVKPVAAQPISPKPMPAPGPAPASVTFTPRPAATPSPSAVKPVTSTAPAMVEALEKGFSPYATFYRSNEDRWAYGIFGGLAHRNGWPTSVLTGMRILTLIFIFPAIAYLFGWGWVTMLLTPSLPTAKVRSYYDLNKGLPSRDSQDLSRIVKIILVGFALMVVLSIVLPKLVRMFVL